jgi:hypothetical protein
MIAKYTVTVSATSGLERKRPTATANATAAFETSETDEKTTPSIAWSTVIRIVRIVSAEFRSSRIS